MLHSMAQQSHFERIVEAEMQKRLVQLLTPAAAGDVAKSAYAAGIHEGLRQSLELYRKAARADVDEDGI